MPQTRECDYCGSEIEPGTGVMFVRTDGTTIHYCSSKCESNDDLGREPRDVEWTAEGQRTEAGEEVQTEPDVVEPEESDEDESGVADESEAEDEEDEAEAEDEEDDAADEAEDEEAEAADDEEDDEE